MERRESDGLRRRRGTWGRGDGQRVACVTSAADTAGNYAEFELVGECGSDANSERGVVGASGNLRESVWPETAECSTGFEWLVGQQPIPGQHGGGGLGSACVRFGLLAGEDGCRDGGGLSLRKQSLIPSFQRPASQVVIRRVGSYQREIAAVMFESLAPFGLQVKDKSVLLKPNLVGLDPHGYINTHPTV